MSRKGGTRWPAKTPSMENRMADIVAFVESRGSPICPHCEATLTQIGYQRQKLSTGFLNFILTCPHCHKVLSTQSWG